MVNLKNLLKYFLSKIINRTHLVNNIGITKVIVPFLIQIIIQLLKLGHKLIIKLIHQLIFI